MTSRTDKELRDDALVFYEEDIEAIDSVLENFLKKSAARCALLVDQDGHMITHRGQTHGIDLDTISALVAGSFAATKALAHQFGEEDFHALFHQGRTGNIQLSLVGGRALLTALFDDSTTIGMVRLYAGEASKRLTMLFKRVGRGEGRETSHLGHDDSAFESGASGALDSVFGE
ncbi:MAG: roadblock/LC7 domain-containing protein [Planctomycetes bacterium]|nr:roadblock/LC7 domain-containing protein [Planctomycetota bacterium]MCB9828227.1 roadblock/LC7 domain-containing protein [Planctomycetota bacterium]MCB9901462.1 roadblock/LC7 domain-containing protein [Planctomycetota bacterium]